MATNVSHGFNIPKHDWITTLKRPFALGRRSKNTFVPNPENTDKVEFLYRTATLGRFQKKEEDSRRVTSHRNSMTPEEGNRKISETHHLTVLEEAKQRFISPEQEDFSAEENLLPQALPSKAQNKAARKLQKAKNYFQNESYKEAKKRFKKMIQEPYQARTTIELYLATIYLLQDDACKAKKYLEGKSKRFTRGDTVSLAQIMYSHANYLIKKKEAPERIRGPFLIFQLYGKTKGFSEEETIMAEVLYKKFCVSNN